MNDRPRILVAINDLIFATKIRSTAADLGMDVILVPQAAGLAAHVQDPNARLLLVDLDTAGADVIEAIRSLKATEGCPRVLAFVSHVHADLAEAARYAGADEVLPRSRFSAELPQLLSGPT